MIIIGIDPGTTRIGYGIVEKQGKKLLHIESGLLPLPQDSNSQKLLHIEEETQKLLRRFSPSRAGVERLFFAKNKSTALRVAEARGVIIATVEKFNIPIFELTPSEVKNAVTGDGNASKQSVAKMVRYFLELQEKHVLDDVTDALAIAIAISNRQDQDF